MPKPFRFLIEPVMLLVFAARRAEMTTTDGHARPQEAEAYRSQPTQK